MGLNQVNSMNGLAKRKVQRLCRLYLIEREDGTDFYFTDHDQTITVDGINYEPAGGYNVSAHQAETGLRADNVEFSGALTSAKITDEDLHAGLYRNARVTETLVDWRYPWAGYFKQTVYWIAEVTYTGEVWQAEVVGINRHLRQTLGSYYTSTCRFRLGAGGCATDRSPGGSAGVNLLTGNGPYDAHTKNGIIVTTVIGDGTTKFEVKVGGAGGLASAAVDGYWSNALVTWESGAANEHTTSEVKNYTAAQATMELQMPTAYDIRVNDTLTIEQGCAWTTDDCIGKFNNIDNFGGYPYIPGPDQARQGPKR